MIPVIFRGNETNFNHNGIGLLKDALTCVVTEVRNGSFDLEMTYPVDGAYYTSLINNNIIQAKPNDVDPPHNFRIREVQKSTENNELTVYAVSITNDLGGNFIKQVRVADSTPQVILNEMKKKLHYPTEFNFGSNITTRGSVYWELNNPLNLIAGEEGSIIDIFGGEIKRNNDSIFVYGRRGKDNVTTIRPGKNLEGFNMTESFEGKYTQILPYFKVDATTEEDKMLMTPSGSPLNNPRDSEVTVFGNVVSSPHHGKYPVNAIVAVDFSQDEILKLNPSKDLLDKIAKNYWKTEYTNADRPSIDMEIDLLQIADSEQFELMSRLELISLTDTVTVYIKKYNVDVLVKVTELKYDVLKEMTVSLVAGSQSRTSLMDDVSGEYKTFVNNAVNNGIQNATAGIVNAVLQNMDGSNIFSGRAEPKNPKKGDIWFKDNGSGDVELYEFDGTTWVRKMYKGFGDDISAIVDARIKQSEDKFDKAMESHDAIIMSAISKVEGSANNAMDLARSTQENLENLGTDIEQKVARQYVTKGDYDTYVSSRTQTDKEIHDQLVQTVSKVPTGPMNLIVNGFDQKSIDKWGISGDYTTFSNTTHSYFYNNKRGLLLVSTTNQQLIEISSNKLTLKPNTKYTLRMVAFGNMYNNGFRVYIKKASQEIELLDIYEVNVSKAEYYVVTFDTGSLDGDTIVIKFDGSKEYGKLATLYFGETSLYEGEFNNAWSPAFEELVTSQQFHDTKSTVDSFVRAIGTRDGQGIITNITRQIMTQDAFVTEVSSYSDHTNNLVSDSVDFSLRRVVREATVTVPKKSNIKMSNSGLTSNSFGGFALPVNVKHFIAGESYTISFDYSIEIMPDHDVSFVVKDQTNNVNYFGMSFINDKNRADHTVGPYYKFTKTFTVNTGTSPETQLEDLYFFLVKNGRVVIRNIMLVRGVKVGPYSPSSLDGVTTRVEQTAGSYAVKFLGSANQVKSQLNLTNDGIRLKSSLIALDGNVTISGTSWMDGAVIKSLSADKVTFGTLDANRVNITNLNVNRLVGMTSTYLQSIIGNAFIDWMSGKVITARNGNMTIDLNGGDIIMKTGSNAIKRTRGYHTAFMHFNEVPGYMDNNSESLYAGFGVTSSGDGVNSASSGRFAGIRAFRAARGTAHETTLDRLELYGDWIYFKDDFKINRGLKAHIETFDRMYDIYDNIIAPIQFLRNFIIHLNNVGWDTKNKMFIDAVLDDWKKHNIGFYGGWSKVNYPK